MKALNLKPLTRAELKTITGGTGLTCAEATTDCNPQCGHFTADYGTFASCMDNYNVQGCSPLNQWGTVCGNYN